MNVNFRHISIHKTPDESPGYLLWRVSTQWRSAIEKTLKQYNLTHPQFVVLAALAWLTKDNKPVNQLDLSKMVSLDPNTTSQIVRLLEKKGCIKRVQLIDERSKNPIVTNLGAELLAQALPAVEKADAVFFSAVTTSEIEELIPVFQRLMRSEE